MFLLLLNSKCKNLCAHFALIYYAGLDSVYFLCLHIHKRKNEINFKQTCESVSNYSSASVKILP